MIKNLAERINSSEDGRQEVFVDPITISIAISVIRAGISAYKACKKTPAQVQTSLKSPGRLEDLKLRSLVRKEMGFFEYQKKGHLLVDKIKKKMHTVTEDEISEAYKELD